MADPAGYVYKDGAYWSTADGSGPYGVTPAGLLIPLFEFAYKGDWSGRPAASAVPAGSKMCAVDVGVGGYSEWVSNGTHWRPMNGDLVFASFNAQCVGSTITPLATHTGTTADSAFVVAGTPVWLPPDILAPGLRFNVRISTSNLVVPTVAGSVRIFVQNNSTYGSGPPVSTVYTYSTTHRTAEAFGSFILPTGAGASNRILVRAGWGAPYAGNATMLYNAGGSYLDFESTGLYVFPGIQLGAAGDSFDLQHFSITLNGGMA